MISQLRGRLLEITLEKDTVRIEIDVQGIGYEVFLGKGSLHHLHPGQSITCFISESVTPFDGTTTLYGFVSREEKNFFLKIRENVAGMGPKKALDCMDKITKSLPDFKRAILENDHRLLTSVFGFTKKTSDKLVVSLKGKIDDWRISGIPKWSSTPKTLGESEALSGLLNMGINEGEAREVVEKTKAKLGRSASTESILKEALRQLATKVS